MSSTRDDDNHRLTMTRSRQPAAATLLPSAPTNLLSSAPASLAQSAPAPNLPHNHQQTAPAPNVGPAHGNNSYVVDGNALVHIMATVSVHPASPPITLPRLNTSDPARVRDGALAMSRDTSSQGYAMTIAPSPSESLAAMPPTSTMGSRTGGTSDHEDEDSSEPDFFLRHEPRSTLSEYYPCRTTGGDYGPMPELVPATCDPSERISPFARIRKIYTQ